MSNTPVIEFWFCLCLIQEIGRFSACIFQISGNGLSPGNRQMIKGLVEK